MSSYQLNDETVEILKNFARIDNQITFKEGCLQRTLNEDRNFIADVELPEPIPATCTVLELNRLLGIIDTCKSSTLPVIVFGEVDLTIEHEHGEVTIPYAHPEVVRKPMTTQFRMIKQVASFDLPYALWTKITRTASVLQTSELHLILTDAGLTLKLVHEKDKGGDATGTASYKMPNTQVQVATPNTWAVKFDSLELLPGDYSVVMGEIGNAAGTGRTAFGVIFTLKDEVKKVTYLTSGTVVKSRSN